MNYKIRRYGIKLLILLIAGGGWLFTDKLINKKNTRENRFHTFKFHQTLYKQFKKDQIKDIYLAGPFSNWKPNDSRFLLKLVKGERKIKFKLKPGRTQYKFVIYTKLNKKPLWVHDYSRQKTTDDGFGGSNSVITIRQISQLLKISNVFIMIIFLILLTYTVFELITTLILKIKLKQKHRMITIFIILLITSNAVLIIFNISQQRQITKLGYEEIINQIVTEIKSNKNRGFARLKARLEDTVYSSTESTLHRLVLFSTNFMIKKILDRKELPSSEKLEASLKTHKQIFTPLIQKLTNRIADQSSPIYGKFKVNGKTDANSEFFNKTPYLGYNLILQPILAKGEVTGYCGIMIFPQLYGQKIANSLFFNIGWSTFITIFAIIFLLYLPDKPDINKDSLQEFYKWHKITNREKEIISLIIKGYDNKKIGKTLYISSRTVKAHIYNIYQKSDVKNRIELINKIKNKTH